MNDTPKDVNQLPFNEALALYDTMRQAYYDGDEAKLAEMQQQYPTLFQEETANLLRSTVELLNKMHNHPLKFTVH